MLRRVALAFALVLPFSLSAAWAQTPETFIQELADEVLSVANDESLDEAAALETLAGVMRTRFAVTTMGAFAAGDRWSTMTGEEKSAYVQAYERYMIGQYARRFGALEDAGFLVTGAQPVGRDTGVIAVITLPSGDQYSLRFRVRETSGGALSVLDVEVQGTSFLLTQRGEFQGLLRQTGGDVEALIQRMDQIASRG